MEEANYNQSFSQGILNSPLRLVSALPQWRREHLEEMRQRWENHLGGVVGNELFREKC